LVWRVLALALAKASLPLGKAQKLEAFPSPSQAKQADRAGETEMIFAEV